MLWRMAALKKSEKFDSLSYNFIKTGLHHLHIPWNVLTFSRHAVSQKISKLVINCKRFLFVCKSNNDCFGKVPWGKLSVCNWRNTVGALVSLIKSDKGLKRIEPFARRCSIKYVKYISKFIEKNPWLSPFIVKCFSVTLVKPFRAATLKTTCERLLLKQ